MNVPASLTIFLLSFRQSAKRYPEALTRSLFYLIIVYIFSQIWQQTKGLNYSGNINQINLVWYLTITELILLSLPLIHVAINRDIRTGELSTWIARPYSYHSFQALHAAGEYSFRFIALGILGCSFAYFLTGTIPKSGTQLTMVVLITYLAGLLHLRFLTIIGLLAVWIQDSTPLYWLWQRMAIVFGGVFIPLFLYPDAVKGWIGITPFAALIAHPASLIIDSSNWLNAVVSLLSWTLILAIWEFILYRQLYRITQTHGG